MPDRRQRVLAAAVTVVLTGGLSLVGVPSASAASSVSFCFRWSGTGSDGVQRSGKPYSGRPVYLIRVVDGHKKKVRTGRTDSRGCGVFRDTPERGRLFVRAATSVAHNATGGSAVDFWSGRTRSADPGDGHANLGTAKVTLRGSISAVSRDRG